MMYYLHHLSGQFIGFNVFLYVTFRAIAAAVTAFLTTLIFGNFIIAKLRALKVEQPIRGAAEVHRLAELPDRYESWRTKRRPKPYDRLMKPRWQPKRDLRNWLGED